MCTFAPPKSEEITDTAKKTKQQNYKQFYYSKLFKSKTNEKIFIPNRPFHPDGGGKFLCY